MEDEDTDPQMDPNIRFQVVVRGWSNKNQQTRATTLLTLSNGTMVKSLQTHDAERIYDIHTTYPLHLTTVSTYTLKLPMVSLKGVMTQG